MRKILFRGKEINTGEWVYGSLLYSGSENQYYIVENDGEELSYPVSKETIGQYTGLKDVNGTEIFEGDIVEVTCKFKGKVEFENLGVVRYKENAFQLDIFTDDEKMDYPIYESVCNSEREDTFIIIGNIHDDAELLEKVKE